MTYPWKCKNTFISFDVEEDDDTFDDLNETSGLNYRQVSAPAAPPSFMSSLDADSVYGAPGGDSCGIVWATVPDPPGLRTARDAFEQECASFLRQCSEEPPNSYEGGDFLRQCSEPTPMSPKHRATRSPSPFKQRISRVLSPARSRANSGLEDDVARHLPICLSTMLPPTKTKVYISLDDHLPTPEVDEKTDCQVEQAPGELRRAMAVKMAKARSRVVRNAATPAPGTQSTPMVGRRERRRAPPEASPARSPNLSRCSSVETEACPPSRQISEMSGGPPSRQTSGLPARQISPQEVSALPCSPQKVACHSCGQPTGATFKFCPFCGLPGEERRRL